MDLQRYYIFSDNSGLLRSKTLANGSIKRKVIAFSLKDSCLTHNSAASVSDHFSIIMLVDTLL